MLTQEEVLTRGGISQPQLSRYCRAGLVTKPVIQRLGKGRGCRSLYDDDTIERIQLLRQPEARGLQNDEKLLYLWLHGCTVGAQRVKSILCTALSEVLKSAETWRQEEDTDTLGVGEAFAQAAADTAPAWLRKRLPNTDDVGSFLTLMGARCFGHELPTGVSRSEQAINPILARGAGLPELAGELQPTKTLNKCPTMADLLNALETLPIDHMDVLPDAVLLTRCVMVDVIFPPVFIDKLFRANYALGIACLAGFFANGIRAHGIDTMRAALRSLIANRTTLLELLNSFPGACLRDSHADN